MFARNALLLRNLSKSMVRFGSHGGTPGENLPFDITNRYKLTAMFVVFFGTGLGAPWMMVRHQLLKK